MKSRIFLLFLAAMLPIYAHSLADVTPQQEFVLQFMSPQIEWVGKNQAKELSQGRYPFFLSHLLNQTFSWKPSGERHSYTSGCDPDIWASRLMDSRINKVQIQGALIQKYFQDCRDEIQTGSTSEIWNTFKFLTIDLNFHKHPFLNRIQFNLPNGVRLQGLLALKGDLKARPIIVMRMGVYTNVDEANAERFFMMSWFEQGPFNVLFLDNISGALFIDQNKGISFGGYDEALQNIQISRLLKDPQQPLSKIISSVHLSGLSLGGNGALYASLLNEYNSFKGHRLINSFMLFCPVTHLKDSLERLTAPNFKNKLVDFWSRRRLAGMEARMSTKPSLFDFLPKAIAHMTNEYRGGLTWDGSVALPPGMQNKNNFWAVNNLVEKYQNVSAPVLSIVTRNDELVPPALNSDRLKFQNFKMVKMEEGFHCTLPIPYNWDIWPSLMNAYFMSHSPNLVMQTIEIPVPVIVEKNKAKLDFKVSYPDNKPYVSLKLSGPFEDKIVNLPLNGFDFRFHNSKISDSEKEMLSRWLNQNLRMKIRGNELVLNWPVVK